MKKILMILAILAVWGCGAPAPTGAKASPTVSHEHSETEEGHGDEHAGHGEDEGGEHAGHGEEGHGDEHGEVEGEEGFVTLTDAQRNEIGLQVAAIGTGQATQGAPRTGRVEADPDRRVVVSPQVSGTVKHLPLIVGSRVRQGELIAMLDSPEITELKGEYRTGQVEVDLASKELGNKRTLIAVGDESRREVEEAGLELARAQATRDGAAARLESAKLKHARLQTLRGEGIASVQQVEEALADRKALEADVQEAKSSVTIALQHLQREKEVANAQLREKAETFPAEASLARANETVRHVGEQLRQLGANPGEQSGTVSLLSPIDGQVVERPVTRGQMVSSGEKIAVLVDPSEVWVWIDLVRADLATVDVGDQVTVSLTADPEVTATGEISHIDAQVDTETQTVRARVSLREPGSKFRVGSFVSASIVGKDDSAPSVPQQAVMEVEGQKVVYRVDGKGYRRTPVQVLSSNASTASVSGLPEGSLIVVKGAVDVKSIDLAGTIGGHSH